MDLNGKRVLVLGAYGQVGSAIVKLMLRISKPAEIILCSLWPEEATAAREQCGAWVQEYQDDIPQAERTHLKARAGNILWTRELEQLLNKAKASADASGNPLSEEERCKRQAEYTNQAVEFIYKDFNQFTPAEKADITLYDWLVEDQPHIVVDCVNTATGLAYMDIFTLGKSYLNAKRKGDSKAVDACAPFAELVLTSAALPALVRHIEVLKNGMEEAGTLFYLKVGTSGTGGMGLNIPYTHSESKPSRQLMSKSAVAGASSLLYLLFSRTKDAPIIKEIKPSSLIGWKSIGYGPIKKHGKPIRMYDCTPDAGRTIEQLAGGDDAAPAQDSGEDLKGVYIDTGENGVFTAAEFETITALEQMELVTAEDVARASVEEILGESTGFDVIGSLSAVCLDSTYRGGVMRNMALEKLSRLEQEHGEGVGYEILGPPKLTKLLWEAYLLKHHGNLGDLLKPIFQDDTTSFERKLEMFDEGFDPGAICEQVNAGLADDAATRQRIISVGIPVMTGDGRWLYGPEVALMRAFPGRSIGELLAEPKPRRYFLDNGAVELAEENISRWKHRLREALRYHYMFVGEGEIASSSAYDYRHLFSTHTRADGTVEDVVLHIGELVGWIFITEENGPRRRHVFYPGEVEGQDEAKASAAGGMG